MALGNIQVNLTVKDNLTWPLMLAQRKALRFTLKLKGII